MARRKAKVLDLFPHPIEEVLAPKQDPAMLGVYALIQGLQAGGTELRLAQHRHRRRAARIDAVIRWSFMWATIGTLLFLTWAGING